MIKKILAPGNDSTFTSCALLALRLWLGLTMLLNHGWGKLTGFGEMSQKFPDLLHIGGPANLALVVFAEFFCSTLLVFGLLTRFAGLVLTINMAVAFFIAHGGKLSGEGNGELAFIYLAGYVTLLIAGSGKYSADKAVFK